jgi:hypothetical protein
MQWICHEDEKKNGVKKDGMIDPESTMKSMEFRCLKVGSGSIVVILTGGEGGSFYPIGSNENKGGRGRGDRPQAMGHTEHRDQAHRGDAGIAEAGFLF